MFILNSMVCLALVMCIALLSTMLSMMVNHHRVSNCVAILQQKGGVCSMFGDSCCACIPNNTAPDGSVSKAIAGLEDLSKEWAENSAVTKPFQWRAAEGFFFP